MKTNANELGDTPALASTLSQGLQEFLFPLLQSLDQLLDRRLVQTFAATIEGFLRQRYRASGLLLSELGAFLTSPAHAPAGTKRLSNLLRSPKWTYLFLEEWLWRQAERHRMELICHNEEALLLWDSSVLEKPESLALEGLRPVRSSEAARLKRIKKGFYTPPGGPPVFVPGMQWLCLLLLGRSGPPTLACMQWGTTRGDLALESPRLWSWANRLKLLLMVSIAYAFFLSLLHAEVKALRSALLNTFCPRTGKRNREVSTPLYRLRQAVCFLFDPPRTPLLPQLRSSG